MTGWVGLERILKTSSFQALPWAGTLPPDQIAASPVQLGLEHLQGVDMAWTGQLQALP